MKQTATCIIQCLSELLKYCTFLKRKYKQARRKKKTIISSEIMTVMADAHYNNLEVNQEKERQWPCKIIKIPEVCKWYWS